MSEVDDEAITDMVDLGFDKPIAAKLIFHISDGQIRHLNIRY